MVQFNNINGTLACSNILLNARDTYLSTAPTGALRRARKKMSFFVSLSAEETKEILKKKKRPRKGDEKGK